MDDVSFNVHQEEIFGLLGPNGAGKSTLIRMMTTLLPITSGRALINGFDVSKQADAARQCMGVIPQALTSDIDLTVEENLSIYAKLYGVPAAERKHNIDELLETVDLSKWRNAQTKTLSGGMRRRLEIARGLVHSPKIFFLDEPTTGLDPVSRVAVWEMLTRDQEAARADHPDHHPLHGRSGPSLRPRRHRGPRQAGGARFADGAQGQRARHQRHRSAIPQCAGGLGRRVEKARGRHLGAA